MKIDIVANLTAIRKMLDKVKASEFDGDLFEFGEGVGCALHHAYNRKVMPKPVSDYIYTSGYSGGRIFSDPDFAGVLETYYGDGAFELFFDTASDCGRNLKSFKLALDKFIHDHSSHAKIVVEYNGYSIDYPDFKTAEGVVKELQKFGLTGICILEVTEKRLTY